ncbi:MAG: SUMF1/EgtB/PvdO family nonheme iron enzyme [Treponema sp.]|nr:SUMF1/EgtB/PvdO family nonheme iron enzyme [Treponema sp.]
MAKTEKTDTPLPEDAVHLPMLLGIRPGVYLLFLYSLILLSLLFLVLLYPGLSKPGAVLVLRSEPLGAAVRVDGVYRGNTPCELFISKGTHPIAMVLPGFVAYEQELVVEGRLVASLLFPLKEQLRATLTETSPGAALLAGAADYAAWSFTGEPSTSYQIPQSLSEGAYRSGPGAADIPSYQRMDKLIKSAARFASTKAGLRDLLRAKYTLDNGGLAPSPLSLVRSIEAIGAYLSEAPGGGLWLEGILPTEMAGILTKHPWYTKQIQDKTGLVPGSRLQGSPTGVSLSLGALQFREIPAGTLVPGGGLFLGEVPVAAFSIAETEVSVASWEAFLEAHPEWRTESTLTLMEQGLVTEDYLVSLDHPASESPDFSSVPGVSWYAAAAYCQWLTGLLPPSWADYAVRLPTEREWEYAAWAGEEAGLRNMIGGHWEWCQDPYAPYPFLAEDLEAQEEIASPERVLRGGAWINPPGSVEPGTRASLPPAFCSAFVSFRPVLAPKPWLAGKELSHE